MSNSVSLPPRMPLMTVRTSSGKAFEFVVAVAKDFAHEVGACPASDPVETHLDGLGDEDVLAGDLIEQGAFRMRLPRCSC